MRRILLAALALLALLAAHVVYWYVPRERPVAPLLGPAGTDAADAGGGRPAGAGGEPLQVLAAGAYDVCLWVPYPHQNLGALASAIGDLGEVVGAAARLTAGEAGEASAARSQEPEEAPTFGPFEVPPASEMVACSDLAGGRPRRLRVVARIYPALAVVAKLAGRLAGNPWLAGGTAGPMRIAWEGRLWSVTAGAEVTPPAAPASATSSSTAVLPTGGAVSPGSLAAPPGAVAAAPAAVAGTATPVLPESLAVVHWTGARPEIPAGYYALTRDGSDLALSLIASGGGGGGTSPAVAAVAGTAPSLLVAVGPDWRGAEPFGSGQASARPPHGGGSAAASGAGDAPRPPVRPPAALALFETGGSRLSSLGDLPGLAVFNAWAPGAGPPRWRLPTEGIFRLLAGRLPTAELAGWQILALDQGSLRQAKELAPRLTALVPQTWTGAAAAASDRAGAGGGTSPGSHATPYPAAGPTAPAGAVTGAAPAATGAAIPGAAGTVTPGAASVAPIAGAAGTLAPSAPPAATGALSLGLWLEPKSALRIVSRIRQFVEKFPLASRRQVELWRDWETVLDPLANCDHAALTATASPPAMRLRLQGCTASGPR